jgi:hypothetical protein
MAKDKATRRADDEDAPSWRNPGGDGDDPEAFTMGTGIMEHIEDGLDVPLALWAGVFAAMEYNEHHPVLKRIAGVALNILDEDAPCPKPVASKKKKKGKRKA